MKIRIEGCPGEGKTTLGLLVSQALSDRGIPCKFVEDEPDNVPEHQPERLRTITTRMLAKGQYVTIETTHQPPRLGNPMRFEATPTTIKDAQLVQDIQNAVNIIAVAGALHELLLGMGNQGMDSEVLRKHPTTRAMISKLKSLANMTAENELTAFAECTKLAHGQNVERP